jgi:phosphate transport system substrate-binding protein
MNKLLGAAAALALLAVADNAYAARDYVWAAGSSTVFPFATRVAENVFQEDRQEVAKVESLGTGGGFKLFCGGTGAKFPDIANASRPMKKSEFEACKKAGVTDIVEIKIGFDGIVVADDKKRPSSTDKLEQLYWASPTELPNGRPAPKNPYKTWAEVGPGLPKSRILVYGPPPTSGTRDAWVELAMEGGAAKLPTLAKP